MVREAGEWFPRGVQLPGGAGKLEIPMNVSVLHRYQAELHHHQTPKLHNRAVRSFTPRNVSETAPEAGREVGGWSRVAGAPAKTRKPTGRLGFPPFPAGKPPQNCQKNYKIPFSHHKSPLKLLHNPGRNEPSSLRLPGSPGKPETVPLPVLSNRKRVRVARG